VLAPGGGNARSPDTRGCLLRLQPTGKCPAPICRIFGRLVIRHSPQCDVGCAARRRKSLSHCSSRDGRMWRTAGFCGSVWLLPFNTSYFPSDNAAFKIAATNPDGSPRRWWCCVCAVLDRPWRLSCLLGVASLRWGRIVWHVSPGIASWGNQFVLIVIPRQTEFSCSSF
jgi:hypothetical protein